MPKLRSYICVGICWLVLGVVVTYPMNNPWSDTLIEQTRSALRTPPMTLDCTLSFKNVDGRFGQIGFNDLVSGAVRVADRRSGEAHLYESADELISAGWAVD
jgi:hypothetical protein